jgi:hypothetical protein
VTEEEESEAHTELAKLTWGGGAQERECHSQLIRSREEINYYNYEPTGRS